MNAHELAEHDIAASARYLVKGALNLLIEEGVIDDCDRDAAIVACLVRALETHCLEAGYADWRAYVVGGEE